MHSEQHYQELEFINSNNESLPRTKFITWLKRVWRFIGGTINNQEPKVWERRHHDGTLYYRTYDPISGQSLDYASEDEVRLWLEQLPYFW